MSESTMRQATGREDPFIARFRELDASGAGNGAHWFAARRREAMARFEALGLPTTRDEEWKYTSVAPLKRHAFQAPEAGAEAASAEDVRALAIDGLDAHRIVLVDGRLAAGLSDLELLGKEAGVESLASALSTRREDIEPRLGREASFDAHAFVALNTALLEDGLYIRVPRGHRVEKPVHIQVVSTGRAEPTMIHPRVLIVLEEGSALSVVEDHVAVEGSAVYFNNAVSEVFLGEDARLDHTKVEREGPGAFHFASLAVHQERASTLVSNSFSLGGALVRNDIHCVLDGEGIECTLNGLAIGAGKQHIDNHTRIVHAKPHCHSWEVYKTVLDGEARGVFNGKIYVAQDAQKTDAKQTNQSLLLSPAAVMDSKPELEIYADDVKCTHGATVGQLDRESIFYLRTRGIDLESARDLLVLAFASDIVEHVAIEPLRAAIETMLFAKLPRSALLEGAR